MEARGGGRRETSRRELRGGRGRRSASAAVRAPGLDDRGLARLARGRAVVRDRLGGAHEAAAWIACERAGRGGRLSVGRESAAAAAAAAPRRSRAGMRPNPHRAGLDGLWREAAPAVGAWAPDADGRRGERGGGEEREEAEGERGAGHGGELSERGLSERGADLERIWERIRAAQEAQRSFDRPMRRPKPRCAPPMAPRCHQLDVPPRLIILHDRRRVAHKVKTASRGGGLLGIVGAGACAGLGGGGVQRAAAAAGAPRFNSGRRHEHALDRAVVPLPLGLGARARVKRLALPLRLRAARAARGGGGRAVRGWSGGGRRTSRHGSRAPRRAAPSWQPTTRA